MRYNLRVIPYICSRYAEKGLSAVPIHRGAYYQFSRELGLITPVFFIFCGGKKHHGVFYFLSGGYFKVFLFPLLFNNLIPDGLSGNTKENPFTH